MTGQRDVSIMAAQAPSFYPHPHPDNKNVASTHKQKCLQWICGTQHHTPRDPGGALLTDVSGDR